jgi:hypothetical protein
MSGPPGHVPGYHLPGTLTPIGAVVAQQQAVAQAADAQLLLLLLLRP